MTPVHPATRIGHVHLKVSDLERAIAFYSGVLTRIIHDTCMIGRETMFCARVR